MPILWNILDKLDEPIIVKGVQFVENTCSLREWFSRNPTILGTTLDFGGPLAGSLSLLIPAEVVSEITADFLGLDLDAASEELLAISERRSLSLTGAFDLPLSITTAFSFLDPMTAPTPL